MRYISATKMFSPLVYIAWGDKTCIYVGMSARGLARPFTNRVLRNAAIERLELRWCEDAASARVLEVKLILELAPVLNIKHRKFYSENPMKSVTIRVYDEDMENWQRAANLRGMSMSEWIRRQCGGTNFVAPLSQPERAGRNNGSASTENLSGVPDREVSGRRTVGGGRGNGGSVRSAKAPGGNRTPRSTRRGNQTGVSLRSTGENRVDSIPGELSSDANVTRDNFAEVAASIPRDELDVWARGLSPDLLPKHSATSNRHTCLCSFCLTWRKANYIPYGGPVKSEKKSRFAK